MDSGPDIVRLTHKQLQILASKYETDTACYVEDKKPVERKRKVKPERSIYVPGQSRLSSSSKTGSAVSPEFDRNSPQRDYNPVASSNATLCMPSTPNNFDSVVSGKTSSKVFDNDFISQRNDSCSSNTGHSNTLSSKKGGSNLPYSLSENTGVLDSRETTVSSESRENTPPIVENQSGERKRERKPEIRRYVPRPRQNQLANDADDKQKDEENSATEIRGSCQTVQRCKVLEVGDMSECVNKPIGLAIKNAKSAPSSHAHWDQKISPTLSGSAATLTLSETRIDRSSSSVMSVEHASSSNEKRVGRQANSNTNRQLQGQKKSNLNTKLAKCEVTSSNKGDAREQLVKRHSETEDEQFEWDYKGDLQINDFDETPVLNWGDIPPPPSGDEWSDDDSCDENKPTHLGIKSLQKRGNRKRKKRPKATQIEPNTSCFEDDTDTVPTFPVGSIDDEDLDHSGVDDENNDPDLIEKFEGLLVTNSTALKKSNSPSNKSVRSNNYPDQSAGISARVGATKNSLKARQQRDRQQPRQSDSRVDPKVEHQESRNERSKAGKVKSEKTAISNGMPAAANNQKFDRQKRMQYQSYENATSSAKVGGIIHLPAGTTMTSGAETDASHEPVAPSTSHERRSQRQSRGNRSQGNRTLWDPRNPDAASTGVRSRQNSYRSGNSESGAAQSEPSNYRPAVHTAYHVAPAYHAEYGSYCQQPSPTGHFYYPDYPSGLLHVDAGYVYGYHHAGYDASPYTEEMHSRGVYELEDGTSQVRAGRRIKVEFLIQEAMAFDVQLSNLISRRVRGNDGLKHVMTLRAEIQRRLQDALLQDVEVSSKKNVEQLLWKSAFYQVIEMLRHKMSEGGEDDAKHELLAVIDEGVTFFESLLHQLQAAHGFSVESFIDQLGGSSESHLGRTSKLALVSCQRLMICLGDLARYREQATHSSNYGRARNWYARAQKVAPKNGRPYNQLAILALYTSRKVDAVYYYVRGLAASNPFLTARESLMQLFEDAAKKAEILERNRKVECERRKTKTAIARRQRKSSSGTGQRVEIWIAVDGLSSSEDRVEVNDEDDINSDDLNSLPMVEVNRSFVLDFLRVHGMLFTKIGMEHFPESCGRLLREFETLLNHCPTQINCNRIIQLIAINMFAIDNTESKDNNMEENCRSVLQEYSVQLGLDMFACLISRLLRSATGLSEYKLEDVADSWREILPGLKAWSDWMTCHVQHWNPPPLSLDPGLGPDVDVWHLLADLFNKLNDIDISGIEVSSEGAGLKPVILPEDTELAGFVPLLSLSITPAYVKSGADMELARDCVRISKLRLFADYLCGIDPPLMSYNVESRRYFSTVPTLSSSDRRGGPKNSESQEHEAQDMDDDVIVEDIDEMVASESSNASAQEDSPADDTEQNISALKARKEELAKKIAEQEKIRENIKAVVDMSQQEFRAIQIEIRPIFVVPDTNCFIDHLSGIQRLLNTKKYTCVIPLVVINELDGLSKGGRDRQSEFSDMLRSGARLALNYLEQEFEARNSHLKSMTSEGTILDTIAFRSEQFKDMGKNDDLILSCCLHYCQDKARDFMPKSQDEPIRLQRNVVLLTNDRNLRLKAHMHNVPTKDVVAFLHWAKVPPSSSTVGIR